MQGSVDTPRGLCDFVGSTPLSKQLDAQDLRTHDADCAVA
jgi:hypothetical protein